MQICKHLRQECNEQISANQFNPQRTSRNGAHKRQGNNHRLHGTEPVAGSTSIRVVPSACALLQSALKERTATAVVRAPDVSSQTRRRLRTMKLYVPFYVIALLLFPPIVVFAIDENPAVKVTQLLKTTSSWDGKQIVYPEGQAEVTALIVDIAPGESTGWHQHPVPSFAFVVEGTLEITLTDGRAKRMEPGDALSEVTGTMHIGRALSKTPVKIVVFYAGSAGKALTISQPSEQNTPQ
jgi:quercetin dioxygenase-like cupin family protein